MNLFKNYYFLFGLGAFLALIFIGIAFYIVIKQKQSNKKILNLIIKGIEINPQTADFINLIEQIWRLEKQIYEQSTSNRELYRRNFDRIKRYFSSNGFEYLDYTNRNYKGLNVEIISVTDSKRVKTPLISNTFKPEIRYMGNIIQKSQVDVLNPIPLEKFTVVFDPNGTNLPDYFQYEEQSIIKEPKEPKKEGFTFNFWLDKENNQPVTFPLFLSRNYYLIAQWSEIIPISKFPVSEDEVDLANNQNLDNESMLNVNFEKDLKGNGNNEI